ncbi:MAG: ribonuclease R, partial [Lacipirellulaceae bacterium]
MSNLREAILRHVNDERYRPVKPKVIAKKLGLENDDVSRVKKEVKKLVREKELAYGPSHLVCPVKEDHPASKVGKQPAKNKRPKHITGVFRRNDSGYGFVRPEGTAKSEGRDSDIFVPANAAGDAASGDTVRIRLDGKLGRKGKPEGRVIDIVERATNRFVGTYFEQADMALVQVDGGVFTKPIYVGD